MSDAVRDDPEELETKDVNPTATGALDVVFDFAALNKVVDQEDATEKPRPRVGVYWHPACALHNIPNHPEQPARVTHILRALHQSFDSDPRVTFREAQAATADHIKLFHRPSLVANIDRWSEEVPDRTCSLSRSLRNDPLI